MPYQVVMPQLGMTMTEGSVVRWLKQPGERIEKGEPLFEVETDKVTMEVESPAEGLVSEILLEPGKTVPVGTVIAAIGGALTAGVAPSPPAASQPTPIVPATAPSPSIRVVSAPISRLASPRAKRLAAQMGVDLAAVESDGDRISEADVVRYLEARGLTSP